MEHAHTIARAATPCDNQTFLTEKPTGKYFVDMEDGTSTRCPVKGCPSSLTRSLGIRQHFRTQHPNDVIVINGKKLPQCSKCGLFQLNAMTQTHQRSKDCIQWTLTKQHRESKNKTAKMVQQTTFQIGGGLIENVQEFSYLGRILGNRDTDAAAVESNIRKARIKWGQVGKILTSQGAYPMIMAMFYKAIVQSVLLYGAESWVLTQEMERKLQSFHHRCARFIAQEHIEKDDNGEWKSPPSKQVLSKLGLRTVQEYIQQRKNTVSSYAETTNIFEQCKKSQPLASAPNQLVWWGR
jgi:hypothetical protein